MKIEHLILLHDQPQICKYCNKNVLITPINLDGKWRCPHCNKESHLFKAIKNIKLEKYA